MLKLKASFVLFALLSNAAFASDWRFVSINGIDARGGAELLIDRDGTLSGSTGCNQFSGKNTYNEGILSIQQPLAITSAACAEPFLDTQERALTSLLSGTIETSYDPYLQELILSGNSQTAVLAPSAGNGDLDVPEVFRANTVVVTGVSGRLNFREAPSTDADVVARIRPDAVISNLGCKRQTDRDWCQLTLEDGVIGWAAADFLRPLTLGRRAKDGSYDEIGRLVCAGSEGQISEQCEYGATLEGDNAIVSVFVDAGMPVVLHFRGGALDPIASFGPFSGEDGRPERLENSLRVTFGQYRLDVPQVAISR